MKDEKRRQPKSGNLKPTFAKKSFGQNFLVDQNYIGKIVAALNPQMGEMIIEIGAGRGALTEKLIESGAKVIAIEIERDMIAVLKSKFGEKENFQLVEADALKINFKEIIQNPGTAKLVANLPYYISTAILQKLIEQREVFSEMILMFQREVVERITAKPGNSERGFLTVLVEAYLETEKLIEVPPNAFQPAPKVQSAVVRLKPKNKAEFEISNEKLFREIISAGFRQKRKTILNNLKVWFSQTGTLLKISNIDSNRRAETLTFDEWKTLSDSFEKVKRAAL